MAEPETPVSSVKEEKKELIEAAKKLPPTESFSLRPRNFEEAYRFSNLIAESDLIPKEFQKKPANVLLAVQLGMELGVAPMQALQSIFVVNGRPAIFGDLLPAIAYQSGLLEFIKEEGDEKQATCTVKRKGHESITRTFTYTEAERAKLPARNPTYLSYPKRMLAMRARAYAIRDAFPDVLKGVYVREELEDIEPVDITPKPEPLKMPEPTKEKPNVKGTANAVESPGDDISADSQPPAGTSEDRSGDPETSGRPNESSLGGTPNQKLEAALKEIAGYTTDTFPNAAHLNVYMKGQPPDVQMQITSAYNAKKKELEL